MAKFSGAAEFGRKLERLPAEAKTEIRRALEENADRMVGLATSLALRDQGDLATSIRREDGEHDLQVRVAAGGPTTTRPVRDGADDEYDYALAAEFGTEHQPPSPYFWPAYRALRSTMRRRLGKAVKAAAAKVTGGSAS